MIFEYNARRINWQGHEIQTYSFGEGSNVIFSFPSFPHSGLYYIFFAKFYPHHNYKFITFDLPGWAGWSENVFEGKEFSMSDLLDIAEAILKEYEVKDFSLIGYSFGTALSFMLAARMPERIKRMVLVSPMIFGGEAASDYQSNWVRRLKRINGHKFLSWYIKWHTRSLLPYFAKHVDEELLDMYMKMLSRIDSKVVLDSAHELFSNSNEELVEYVKKVPHIMIVNSEDEPELFRRQAEKLRRIFEGEYTLKMSGTHDDFIMKPTSRVVNDVMDFLTESRPLSEFERDA